MVGLSVGRLFDRSEVGRLVSRSFGWSFVWSVGLSISRCSRSEVVRSFGGSVDRYILVDRSFVHLVGRSVVWLFGRSEVSRLIIYSFVWSVIGSDPK